MKGAPTDLRSRAERRVPSETRKKEKERERKEERDSGGRGGGKRRRGEERKKEKERALAISTGEGRGHGGLDRLIYPLSDQPTYLPTNLPPSNVDGYHVAKRVRERV